MPDKCPICGFELFHPIATLEVSSLGLYDDARFPGRSILVLNEHYEDLMEVPPELALALIRDLRTAGRAIKRATGSQRMNYAILGNAEPHVHVHLIPRKHDMDPIPTKSPWEHPAEKSQLSAQARIKVLKAIASELRNAKGAEAHS